MAFLKSTTVNGDLLVDGVLYINGIAAPEGCKFPYISTLAPAGTGGRLAIFDPTLLNPSNSETEGDRGGIIYAPLLLDENSFKVIKNIKQPAGDPSRYESEGTEQKATFITSKNLEGTQQDIYIEDKPYNMYVLIAEDETGSGDLSDLYASTLQLDDTSDEWYFPGNTVRRRIEKSN